MMAYEQRMNESIVLKTGLSDALIGRFGTHPLTQDISIEVEMASTYSDDRRELCILERIDCNSQPNTEDASSESIDQLECPDSSKNRQCGTFQWVQYGFTKDDLEKKYCIAMNTVSEDSKEVALHDSNSCGDYGATRLWFRKYDGKEMFNALIIDLNQNPIDAYIFWMDTYFDNESEEYRFSYSNDFVSDFDFIEPMVS